MRDDDLVRYKEAEAEVGRSRALRATILATRHGLEDRTLLVDGNWVALVMNRYLNAVVLINDGDRNNAVLSAVSESVPNES